MRRRALLVLCTLSACGVFDPAALPPFGEALVIVDTDLPVPRVASRLRVDLYAEDGAWFATRDDVRPDPRDWPTSFSVFSDDESRERTVIVRLRAYPDGRQTRYRGHVYASLPDLLRGPPVGDGEPRLVEGGVDRTPELEPDPTLAVDRLVKVRLVPGKRGRVHVVLRGACAGRVAVVAGGADARSCVDGPEPLAPVVEAPLDETLSRDAPSVAGTYGAEPCDGARGDARVCVPGGAFVFGDAFFRPFSSGGAAPVDSRPERVVRVSRFWMDRDEVTVGRYRAAVARGLVVPVEVGVSERDGPPGAAPDEACTFSALPRDRESYALSCVPWVTADALCRFEGGALPTEVQWEYAALAAGRARKVTYPWGDDPPSCDRAVYERGFVYRGCVDRGEGLVPIDAEGHDENPLGLRDLAGGLEEHTADSHARLDEACWVTAPDVDPTCALPAPPECLADPTSLECRVGPGWVHAVRGASWASGVDDLRGVERTRASNAGSSTSVTGFRCVYPSAR